MYPLNCILSCPDVLTMYHREMIGYRVDYQRNLSQTQGDIHFFIILLYA